MTVVIRAVNITVHES